MLLAEHALPVDARLGVAGAPQSATGQTTLLTGVNAARIAGRHVEGFPGKELKQIIVEHNIFARMKAANLSATFANGYFVSGMSEVHNARFQSVTTVAALSAFGSVRDRHDIENNRAVYHDLTRESLLSRGYSGPVITPREAAQHLLAIAGSHDLTLFEYFQSDRAGHRADMAAACSVLALLDRFLETLLQQAPPRDMLLVVTSDHGNVEDLSTPLHTHNPVPFVAVGRGATKLQDGLDSLTDVTPALLAHALGSGR
jgi:hypothetical protein